MATRPSSRPPGMARGSTPDYEVVDDVDLADAPAVKLLARAPQMRSEDVAQLPDPVVGDLAEVTFSTSNGLIELAVPDTHKASGLVRLAELTGLPTDAVVAFGRHAQRRGDAALERRTAWRWPTVIGRDRRRRRGRADQQRRRRGARPAALLLNDGQLRGPAARQIGGMNS